MRLVLRVALFGAFALTACEARSPVDGAAAAGSDASAATGATTSSGASSGASSGGVTAGGSGGAGGSAFDACKQCGPPSKKGVVESSELQEASGLAASFVHPGVYYVHNDSGDTPRFFAIDEAGHDLGTYEVGGAFAVDWEDAAAGPCSVGRCVFFGDIGDNTEQRSSYTVYRVVEPQALEAGKHEVPGEALPFTYPDGSHNAETLLVHPMTGEVVIVTKVSSGPSAVYRFPMPLTPGVPVVLEKLGSVEPQGLIPRFTGGSIHPKGTGILLRTYTGLYHYALNGSLAAALAAKPCNVPVALEPQGEAVEWNAAGDGYVTLGEGAQASVNVVRCP